MKRLVWLALFLSGFGCHGHQSPDDTFRAFTVAVLSHQADTAWALLSKESQEAMTAATKEAAAQSPKDAVPSDPKAFLFGEDTELARPITDIKILSQSEKDAQLEVTTAGGKHTVNLVSEGGAWRLDLTDGLKL